MSTIQAVPVRIEERRTLTPENLTWEDINGWSATEMKAHMGSILVPGPLREAVARLAQERQDSINKRVTDAELERQNSKLTPGQRRAIEEQNQQVEQERLAAEAAAAPVVPEVVAPVVAPVVPEPPKKIVLEYQVTDETGKPLGRPTHLEALTQEELIEKMKEAHTQATRAFHRLKNQKVTSLREANSQIQPTVVPQMTDAEMLQAAKELKSDDPTVALAAHKKLNKAESDRIQAEADAKLNVEKELLRQKQVSYQFLTAHQHDYNNCEANIKMLKEYFEEHQLPWTSDNLEIAFHDLESELAPVATPVVPTPPANPAPAVVPVVATPAAAAAAQPTPTVTAQVTPPANPAPAQPRPGVNGGIVPGQTSVSRPASTPKGITKAEIMAWDAKTMREKMRNPQLRAEIQKALQS